MTTTGNQLLAEVVSGAAPVAVLADWLAEDTERDRERKWGAVAGAAAEVNRERWCVSLEESGRTLWKLLVTVSCGLLGWREDVHYLERTAAALEPALRRAIGRLASIKRL